MIVKTFEKQHSSGGLSEQPESTKRGWWVEEEREGLYGLGILFLLAGVASFEPD